MTDFAAIAVRRSIEYMYERFREPITVDSIAGIAAYSRFHFTRIFREFTGISPGRFLSAIRLQEAKRLLLATDLSVLSISIQVGYNSLGTFSSRFSSIVGMSPKMFRSLNGYAPASILDTASVDDIRRDVHERWRATLKIDPAERLPGPVFVGLFPERIPQGLPSSCMVLDNAGTFALTSVRSGTWNLLAYSWAADPLDDENGWNHDSRGSYVGICGPLHTSSKELSMPVSVKMRKRTVFDPPILMALPDLRRQRRPDDGQELRKMAA